MSRWNRRGWYERPQMKPAPDDGIRMKSAGNTWWGKLWIAALESILRGDASRLARGRTYARGGRVHGLVVAAGKATAKVTGSRSTPYEITIEVARLDAATWRAAIAAMAAKAQFSASLLAGEMPEKIDEAFLTGGASLFPRDRHDLTTTCTCPDWGDPCKHVAATHYVLGEAFDKDPFLLFEMRGKTKDEVLDELRAARVAESEPPPKKGRAKKAKPVVASGAEAGIDLSDLTAENYERPRTPMPRIRLHLDEPVVPGALLRQLGQPPNWDGIESPERMLGDIVAECAGIARTLMMLEEPMRDLLSGPASKDSKDEPPKRVRHKPKKRTTRRRS